MQCWFVLGILKNITNNQNNSQIMVKIKKYKDLAYAIFTLGVLFVLWVALWLIAIINGTV